MKCFTAKEKAMAQKALEVMMDQQAADIVRRSQGMVYAAMLNAGLSVRTVNRVIAELPDVVKAYAEMRKDRMADYDLLHGLAERGVNVEMTEREL